MTPRRLLPALLAAGLSLTGNAPAEEAGPVFVFDTGTPPWRGERILLPPGFAPDLGWQGVEEIRFAPGMFDPASDSFFSYVLVFSLAPGADISESALERELLTYYRGLSAAVMRGKERSVETGGFTLALTPSDAAESAPASATGVKAYAGALQWIEPFATGRDQTLHFEIHTWQHAGRPVVLSCVSPAKPGDGAWWRRLREIRGAFRFDP